MKSASIWVASAVPTLPKVPRHPRGGLNFGIDDSVGGVRRTAVAVLALPTFKRTTQHGYRAVLKVHVLPTWRDTPLREIDRLAIQHWVADRLRRGIGWQSVRNAWALLSSILEMAVEYGYLQSSRNCFES